MYIIGIHIGHESSAALLKDGRIIGAIQEERFDRIKNSSNFPNNAIHFLLNKEKINKSEVDFVALPGASLGKELALDVLKRRLGYRGKKIIFWVKLFLACILNSDRLRKNIYNEEKTKELLINHVKKIGFTKAKILFLDHHMCHAASAFYSSPFQQALVITQDGKGDGSSGTVFLGKGTEIVEIARQKDSDSIGQFYAEITRFLGFRPNRHEGKITGLAAYGDPRRLRKSFRSLIDETYPVFKRSETLDNVSDWERNLNLLDKVKLYSSHPDQLPYNLSSFKFQEWLRKNFSHETRENISAAIQFSVEEWVVNLCSKHYSQNSEKVSDNIVLAGGLFANVKINQKVLENTGVKNTFVQPAMGDSGLSLGAAQYVWYMKKNKDKRKNYFKNTYLGKEYDDSYVVKLLSKNENKFTFYKSKAVEKEIANFINNGFIVGNFQGRSEWGPRALGNRSILIRPTDKTINDTVNQRLNRSEFMPFAPSVIDFKAKDYFKKYDNDHVLADYMTITYNVFEEKINEIQAVVHIDGTARPQIVRAETNLKYYNILREYEKISGIGCIVNTSFNLHEEPIVESPDEALRAFDQGAVDILIINDFIIKFV